MPPKTSFDHLIGEADKLSEDERNRIADGVEDEYFLLDNEDYASDDEFRQAVVNEIMRLLAL